jgi:hypothetical protein
MTHFLKIIGGEEYRDFAGSGCAPCAKNVKRSKNVMRNEVNSRSKYFEPIPHMIHHFPWYDVMGMCLKHILVLPCGYFLFPQWRRIFFLDERSLLKSNRDQSEPWSQRCDSALKLRVSIPISAMPCCVVVCLKGLLSTQEHEGAFRTMSPLSLCL